MITIQKAKREHAEGIAKVCAEGYRTTYVEHYSKAYSERMIKEFYTEKR